MKEYSRLSEIRKDIEKGNLRLSDLVDTYLQRNEDKPDFTISPTSPHPAFTTGSISKDPIAMYLEDIFTVHTNPAGNPAISDPGLTNKEGMPFGIQVLGKTFGEDELFSFAKMLDEIKVAQ